MANFDDVPDGVLAGIVGIRANLTVSTLVGVIIGLSLATVLQFLNVEPIFGVDGYSLVDAFAGGGVTSWIVSKAS